MIDYSQFKCPFIRPEEIRRKAEDFRQRFWTKAELPVNVEWIIEEKLKMNIIPEHGIRKFGKIDAFLKSDFSGIVVDHGHYMDKYDRYINRLRFSFAHELGHFILHRSIYEGLSFNDLKDYSDFILNMPESEYRSFEFQANEFAGRLLVPKEVLINEIDKVYNLLKQNKMLNFLENEPDQVLEGVSPELCKPFGVSEEVIIIRVQREELWPPR